MRKSTLTSRSSLPRGISSRQRTLGRALALGSGSASGPSWVGAEQVAQEVLLALARGAEQVRAPDEEHAREVRRARSGRRPRSRSRPALSSLDHVLDGVAPAASRLVGELRAGCGRTSGRPGIQPMPHRLRVRVDRGPARRTGPCRAARRTAPGAGGRSATARCACSTRRCPAPGAAGRRQSSAVGDRLPAGERADLLLADVVRPAAAVDADAAAQQQHRDERAVGLVGVEPVVGAGAHADHRAAAADLGVAGELARDLDRHPPVDAGDRLLPGGRVGRDGVVVAGRPVAGQALAARRRR